jgi:excisionase family DNA binding protein
VTPERLLTARELGELLNLSTATVLDWHEAERIPSFKLGTGPNGPVQFRASEVLAWLEECRRGPAPSQRPGKVL